jgi:carbamoyl-phosphate synthase large subunit
MRSLEVGSFGFESRLNSEMTRDEQVKQVINKLRVPGAERLWFLGDAFRLGFAIEEIYDLCAIDPWFLAVIEEIIQTEARIQQLQGVEPDRSQLRGWKRDGFSDHRLSELLGVAEDEVRLLRHQLGIRPVYKRVDSCAAEFGTPTAYMYSTYEQECEADPEAKEKIIVLGGGPNRIGQGIEFDYCCVHASMALREDGWQTIMVNCNPETVSTDYDTSDRLYLSP